MVLFSTAFLMVLLAEMGDKTQLIAMMFATRYPWPKVLLAIGLASIANHLIAVYAGYYLNGLVAGDLVLLISSILFILCGLMIFYKKEEESEQVQLAKGKHIIFTVFTIFFLGEMGDKTQLSAFMLSAQTGHSISIILAGTVLAMLVASSLGIFLGTVLRKYLKPQVLKIASSLLFVIIGCGGLYNYFM